MWMWPQTCWICIALLGLLGFTNSANIRCYRRSLDDYDAAPLLEADTLLKSSCYNSSINSTFYIFGFGGKVDGNATTAVVHALILKNGNVFLIDWEKQASSIDFLGDVGTASSYVLKGLPLANSVGVQLGEALIKMSDAGLNLTRTYMIGHSLGAQVLGFAARYVKIRKRTIYRITGLDPAGPGFGDPPLMQPLGSDCASFVDVVHTDPGGLGLNASHAHVDFYANFGRFITGTSDSQVQPGCPTGNFPISSPENRCSHDRSWMLLIEAWFYPGNLIASQASSYYQWVQEGTTTPVNQLGDCINRTATGIFYMTTNAEPLYGKGKDGLSP